MEKVHHNQEVVQQRLSALEDAELVRIAKLQLPYVTTAFETLFSRYHGKLMQVCYRNLRSQEEAEETVNDVMLSVFNNLNGFANRSSFKTWVYKIAHNQAISRLRKKKLDEVDLDNASHIAAEPTGNTDELCYVNDWLNTLELEDRSIVVFRIAGDLEFKEISEITGHKLSAVKMRYKRAMEKLSRLHKPPE